MFLANLASCIALSSLLFTRSAGHSYQPLTKHCMAFQNYGKRDRPLAHQPRTPNDQTSTKIAYSESNNQPSSWDRSNYPKKQKTKNHRTLQATATNTTTSSGYLRVDQGVSNSYNHHDQAQTMDRLRVDLMRTKLSVKAAEDRAKRLEIELKEMRIKYNRARSALREERAQNSSLPRQTQVQQPQVQQPLQRALQGQQEVQLERVGQIEGKKLPPMAAALFANAEREEMKRRLRTGVIDKADIMDEFSTGRLMNEGEFDGGTVVSPNGLATTLVGTEEKLTLAAGKNATKSSSSTAAVATKTKGGNNESSVIDNMVNATIRNNNLNLIKSNNENDDQLQKLLKKCASLTRQQAILQRKLSRSQDLTHAQTISHAEKVIDEKKNEAERVMDAKWKEEWDEGIRRERDEWKKEKSGFEHELENLVGERDCLLMQLDNQNSIAHMVTLLCSLLRDKSLRMLSKCRSSPPQDQDRMLAVGGATNQRGNRSLGSMARRFLQILKATNGGRNVHQQQKYNNHALRRSMAAGMNNATGSDPASTSAAGGTSSSVSKMPLLVRKKRSRPRLYHPTSMLASKTQREKSASSEVPEFLRKDGESSE